MVWYKFLLLIAVGATAAMGMLKQYAPVLGNFLAALFALLMYNSHQAAVLSRSVEGLVCCTGCPCTFHICVCEGSVF